MRALRQLFEFSRTNVLNTSQIRVAATDFAPERSLHEVIVDALGELNAAYDHAATLNSLIDGEESDDLGAVLAPIRDFLSEVNVPPEPSACAVPPAPRKAVDMAERVRKEVEGGDDAAGGA